MKVLNSQPISFLNSGGSKLYKIQMPISVCTVPVRTAMLKNTIIINENLSAKRTANDLEAKPVLVIKLMNKLCFVLIR